jgi:hypothetical protein
LVVSIVESGVPRNLLLDEPIDANAVLLEVQRSSHRDNDVSGRVLDKHLNALFVTTKLECTDNNKYNTTGHVNSRCDLHRCWQLIVNIL